MLDFSKMDGSKFYIGIGALVLVAVGQVLVPNETGHFINEINLLDVTSVEGQGWGAWMLWAFRSAMKKLEG